MGPTRIYETSSGTATCLQAGTRNVDVRMLNFGHTLGTTTAIGEEQLRPLKAILAGICVFLCSSLAAFESWALTPEEASNLLREPHRVLLLNASFDPRAGEPPVPRNWAAEDLAPGDNHSFLVTVRGGASRAAATHLESFGARVMSYVPNQTYLVRMDPHRAAELRRDDRVLWVGSYRPDYKVSPEIGTRTFVDPDRPVRDGEFLLVLSVFEGESAQDVAEAARALGAEVTSVDAHPRVGRVIVRARHGDERKLAGIDAVEWIEELGEITLRNNTTRWVAQSNVTNALPLWDAGLHGENQVIGHIDGGISMTSCYFLDLVNNTPGPAHRKVIAYRGGLASDSHGTHTACTSAGINSNGSLVNAGIAYNAKVSHTKYSLITGFNNTTSNLYAYLDSASVNGANVHTNSWGDDGTTAYTTWCRDIDRFSRDREDDLVLFAVTNGSFLTTPENAKNCVGVGASRQAPQQDIHGSGGNGPTNDGRRKPEIYLPGVGIVSATVPGACVTGSSTGTSMACPAVTGAAALIRQYYEEGFYPSGAANVPDAFVPSAALVKATLLNSGQDMTGVSGYPSNREGWGRALLDDALFLAGDTRQSVVRDVRHAVGLDTGEEFEMQIHVENTQTLRVTLVFTDQPAALGAALTPINNLDLEVEAPGGIYRGNVFSAGNSALGGLADNLNNVERVQLPVAAITSGDWTIRVRASLVPAGPQGFALHISGDVTELPSATGALTTSVDLGQEVVLAQNTPNPFAQWTRVEFTLPQSQEVDLSVYDIGGRRIRSLDQGRMEPGAHSSIWDGRDENGERVSAGIYFLRLTGRDLDLTRKMVLLQ